MTDIIRETLDSRERDYGSFFNNASLAQSLKFCLHQDQYGRTDDPSCSVQNEALDMICSKMARIKFNPNHKDSWVDIAGYAQLVVDHIEKDEHNKPLQKTFVDVLMEARGQL